MRDVIFLVGMAGAGLADYFDVRALIIVSSLILVAVAVAAVSHRRRVVLAWNALGLFDIVLTVATAQKLALVDHDPLMIGAFGYAPFGLLPFFVVPLVVLSHLAIFARMRR